MQIFSFIFKSIIFSLIAITISYFFRVLLKTNSYITDVGALSSFATLFGTLYGITTAFVVFEVWGQYNRTHSLVDKEALALERLFRLTLYFKDKKIAEEMAEKIKDYIDLIIKSKFKMLGNGERNTSTALNFRQISSVIKSVEFANNQKLIIFNQIVEHYGKLHEIRTERVNQSLTRLPKLLKIFLYLSSFLAIGALIVMPFANWYYQILTVGGLTFIITMIFQLVEDLDNPFKGYWNITTEPFERALQHIEEDYKT